MTINNDLNEERNSKLFPYFVRRGNPQAFSAGFINSQGEIVIPAAFQEAGAFREGSAPVRDKQLWGVIDISANLIVPCQWRFPLRFVNGFALVREVKGGRELRGFLRRDGHWIVRSKYVLASAFSSGLAQVFDGLYYGFINEQGEEAIPLTFEDARPFREGLAPVKHLGRWGYINTSGRFVIEPRYDFGLSFSEGAARVQKGEKWGLINGAGDWTVEPKFDLLWDMHCGRCAATTPMQSMGFINADGEWVVEPTYSHVSNYQEDLAWVKPLGQKAKICIDLFGRRAFSGEVLDADPFYQGLSLFETESNTGYLDNAGRVVWQGKYVERTLGL